MAEHTTGTRWLEAVVEGSPRKEPAKSKTATLIVYGPSGVRLEITEAKQVGLAAQLLRELDGKGRC